MIDQEALRKIKQLEITTRRLLSGTLMGDSRSAVKGSGIEFDQIREYQLGDDVRFIDWSSSARMNKLLVKQYIEERNRTVLLAVDVSASQAYGSNEYVKRDIVAQIAGLLALAAQYGKDNVGLLLFSDEVEVTIAPGAGRKHVRKILEILFSHKPKKIKTDINAPLVQIAQWKRKDTIVFLISDFIADAFEKSLSAVAKNYELVAVRYLDKNEQHFPTVGFLTVQDFETGQSVLIDTRSGKSAAMNQFLEHMWHEQDGLFKKYGVDVLPIAHGQHFIGDLIRFFRRRMRY